MFLVQYMPQCKAKNRKTGEQCRGWAVPGRNVCRYHGGNTLSGIASTNYKHGRYSRYVPARLLERYQEGLTDPDLIALNDDMALLEARLADLLSRADQGEAGSLFERLDRIWQEFLIAQSVNDGRKMIAQLNKLGAIIERGRKESETWGEVATIIELRRKVSDTERKRRVEMQNMISAEQAMALIKAISEVIRREVTDLDSLARISEEIRRLMVHNQNKEIG